MIDKTTVFCISDNIVKAIDKNSNKNKVGRPGDLSKAEYVTLAILKQEMGIKTTKDFHKLVKEYMKVDFSNVPSYQQFCDGMKSTLKYFVFISWVLSGIARKKESGYYIVDSTPLPVCNNNYRFRSKIFKGLASSGKNMNGWYFGFKLHIIINDSMEIASMKITDGSHNDLAALDENFVKDISGWLVGDKGYIGAKKATELAEKGIKLVTRTKKNMKKYPALKVHNYLLSKRQSVESVFSYLKHRLSAVCAYARSAESYFVGVFSAIVAYTLRNSDNTGFIEELIS
jgi:IS5 family transposase